MSVQWCGRSYRWMCVAVVALVTPAWADVKLPHVISSGMVLQRDLEVPIWGWADPGEEVTVSVSDQKATATTDTSGKWMVKLRPLTTGGPYVITVAGRNTIELKDVLVGEVWLCSGQSNMEMGIRSATNGDQEIAAANFPQIRLFFQNQKVAAEPQNDVDATWRPCTPDNLGSGGFFNVGFSAVGYFFGRELHRELKVPVGLIQAAWGGTRIEPWIPPVGFEAFESLHPILETVRGATPAFKVAIKKALSDIEAWLPGAKQAASADQPVPPPPAWPKHLLEDSNQPTGIYNGMIHPIVPFAIRGVLWYQGESNVPDGMAYLDKMKALIGGWRKIWNQGDFPFYYVQIAPFDANKSIFRIYADEQVPRLWEAQTAALAIPNTGMAVTNDIGDLLDIHPKNKLDVAKRLLLWALAKTYGRTEIVYSGPLYKSMKIESDKIRISFDHIGGGLVSRDNKPLNWFWIAGEDRKFVEARAQVDGQQVLVWSESVPKPVAVRYAWSMAAQPNLMNKEGLPASGFRTDNW